MNRWILAIAGILSMAGCRNAEDADLILRPGRFDIVVSESSPKTVRFAAEEIVENLGLVLGRRPDIVSDLRPGRPSIVLGSNEWSRAVGIDTRVLKRDEFVLKRVGDVVYIAGRDDCRADLAKAISSARWFNEKALENEHATLFGVYDFLERFAGVRFYFPGEMGTVTPRLGSLSVGALDERHAPVFTVRNLHFCADGAVPKNTGSFPYAKSAQSWKMLHALRLRRQTAALHCVHGQRGFKYKERFAAGHPEYFALVKRNGGFDRATNTTGHCESQLCHSSAVWDEIYKDCRSYLIGEDAKVRGIPSQAGKGFGWNYNCAGRIVDVMPDDGMPMCQCAKCQRAYDMSKTHFATDLIWHNTSRLADRLESDGLDFMLTQMAYVPYADVPSFNLNSNIQVMVAAVGPWACVYHDQHLREIDKIRQWTEKLNHKVWLWTYPSKFGNKACPGIPDMAPRAWAEFYKATVPYSIGAFCEAECEQAIFHYLNYAVFSKLAWDPGMDVDKFLEEHFAAMFGEAAGEMEEFYSDLEERWTRRVLGNGFSSTPLGTSFKVLPENVIWGDVYSPAVQQHWRELFERAHAKVPADSVEAKRVDFIRREFYDNLVQHYRAYDPQLARKRFKTLKSGENLVLGTNGVHALAVVSKGGADTIKMKIPGGLKPSSRYRFSINLRLKDVVANPNENGGLFLEGWIGRYIGLPSPGVVLAGSSDWLCFTHEFTTSPDLTPETDCRLSVSLVRCTGKAWVECASLVEVTEARE